MIAPTPIRAAHPQATILRHYAGAWIPLTTATALGHPSGRVVASGVLTADGAHHAGVGR